MLTPTRTPIDSFTALMQSPNGYSLSDARLDIPNPTTAIFSATLNGPPGASVWARAWLSTEEGTLAEAASPQLMPGDRVKLEVILKTDQTPQNAVMRIESAPLQTEQVIMLRLV
jgi:hypothetical protein